MRQASAHHAVGPARNGDYHHSAPYRGAHDRQPLVREDAEAVHQPHACGHEEKAEVMHQKVGEPLHPLRFHYSGLERRRQQHHADYARRHRDACEPNDEFPDGEERKQYSELRYHLCKNKKIPQGLAVKAFMGNRYVMFFDGAKLSKARRTTKRFRGKMPLNIS